MTVMLQARFCLLRSFRVEYSPAGTLTVIHANRQTGTQVGFIGKWGGLGGIPRGLVSAGTRLLRQASSGYLTTCVTFDLSSHTE